MRKLSVASILLALTLVVSCGGGGGSSGAVTTPIDLDGISEGETVAVNSSFKYSFSQDVDEDTVTDETFFMHEASAVSPSLSVKAAYDSDACDPDQAIGASVTCTSSKICILDPDSNLSAGTVYSICIKPGTPDDSLVELGISSQKAVSEDSGVLNSERTEGMGYYRQITTSGDAVAEDECAATTECSEEQYCYFGSCIDYADLGITIECEDSTDCAGESGEFVICATMPNTTDGSCDATYCTDLIAFFTHENQPDLADCEAEGGTLAKEGGAAESIDDAEYCWPAESYACYEESEEEVEEQPYLSIIYTNFDNPVDDPFVGVGEAADDAPLNLADYDDYDGPACDSEVFVIPVSSFSGCDPYNGGEDSGNCLGIQSGENSAYVNVSRATTRTENGAHQLMVTGADMLDGLNMLGGFASGSTLSFYYFYDFESALVPLYIDDPYELIVEYGEGDLTQCDD